MSFDVRLGNDGPHNVSITAVSGHISIASTRCNATPSLEKALTLYPMGQGDMIATVRQAITPKMSEEIRSILAKDDGNVAFDLTHLVLSGWRVVPGGIAQPIALQNKVRTVWIVGPIRFTPDQSDLSNMRRFETTFGSQNYYDGHGRRVARGGNMAASGKLRILRATAVHFLKVGNRLPFMGSTQQDKDIFAARVLAQLKAWEEMVLEIRQETTGADNEWDRFKVLGNMSTPDVISEKIDRLDALIAKLTPDGR